MACTRKRIDAVNADTSVVNLDIDLQLAPLKKNCAWEDRVSSSASAAAITRHDILQTHDLLSTQIANTLRVCRSKDLDSDLLPAFKTRKPKDGTPVNWTTVATSARHGSFPHAHSRMSSLSAASSLCGKMPGEEKWTCHHNPILDRYLASVRWFFVPTYFDLPRFFMSMILQKKSDVQVIQMIAHSK